MGTLRSRAFLRCFYCGKKSNIRFDGQKSFDCAQCDATNWLDPNGDITDPPIDHHSRDASPVRYAIPRSNTFRSPSPPPTSVLQPQPDHPIFCSACIRNQHMLNSSLAQFEWPDDPTTTEYAARERKFWALRKDLETRYPQVCQDCAPKVNQKLNQASYAAQTDHLRRMMDRTRAQKETKKWSPLDTVDTLGRWCWYIGFILQAIWHITIVCFLLTEQYATKKEGSWLAAALSMLRQAVASALPHTDRLMQWAINLGLCSFPWNPRFKQSIRGFTAHILGFRQWYTYQLFIVLMRLICLSIAQYSKSQGLPIGAQLGAQLFIPLLMVYVYDAARRSIRTDTSPLFRRPVPVSANSPTAPRKSPAAKSSNDLGNILDEILHSADTKGSRNQSGSAQQASANAFQATPRPYQKSNGQMSTIRTSPQSQPSFGDLRLSDSAILTTHQEPIVAHYDEEMDWSPSASQHRAFSSYNSYKIKNTNPRFGDTPIEQKAGPIWYKVPPAPTNPAQMARNPPMRPIIRESPKDTKENFFQSTRRPVDLGGKPQPSASDFTLSQPKFYAPQPKDDPRDGLSRMFASSFSLSPSPEEAEARMAHANQVASSETYESGTATDRTTTRVAELFALVLALGGWIFALGSTEHYAPSVAMASICGCLIVSIRLAADLEVDRRVQGRGQSQISLLQPCLASLALAQVAIILLLMWSVWSAGALQVSGTFGNALFGCMMVHHIWHIFA
ncbi:hypothetical protein GGR57DRAFT_454145 [Xylariaceae sp. FL1272]|nr:hypothetical protein GGR57DRAFT_454145 [Xylariaceae sp. FL1272]